MTNVSQLNQIYKCNVCGNMLEVIHVGGGEPVCCGQPMELLQEKTSAEEGKEKHIPVMEGSKVKIGSVPHPMEESHYIEWIEIIIEGQSCKKFLKPGDKPEAIFSLTDANSTTRAYCNIHYLWKS